MYNKYIKKSISIYKDVGSYSCNYKYVTVQFQTLVAICNVLYKFTLLILLLGIINVSMCEHSHKNIRNLFGIAHTNVNL